MSDDLVKRDIPDLIAALRRGDPAHLAAAACIEALEAENRRAWAVANQKMERNHKRGETIEALEREKAELAEKVERLKAVASWSQALMDRRDFWECEEIGAIPAEYDEVQDALAALTPNSEQDR